MTLKQAAQSALDVQTACNLSGVVFSFAEVMRVLCDDRRLDTNDRNKHAICRLYAEQIAHLSGAGVPSDPDNTYRVAYETCKRLAE